MTVLEVPTNGDVNELARRDAAAGMSRADLAAKYGMSDGWAGIRIRESGRTNGRSVAPGPVPVVVTDGKREVPPPARTKTQPKPKAKVADRGVVDWVIIGVVTAVAAIWSYSHIVDLSIAAGHGWRSYLLPLAIDGLLVAGVRAVGRDRRYPIAWIAIAVGVIGTVAGNVLAVRPELADLADVAAVSAAFPAIALPTIVHLVRR